MRTDPARGRTVPRTADTPWMANTQHESPIVIYAAIAANLGIAVAKFVAAALTGSSSMISEGVHSVVDTGNQALLLLGIHRSRRRPDDEHPFGHGKELYFWSLVVAIVLFGIGGGVSLYEGITHLIEPSVIDDPLPNFIVLGIAFVLEGTSWTVALRALLPEIRGEGVMAALRTNKDPSLVTVLLEDSAALTGLLTAAIGIALATALDEPRFDGLASIVIGVLLALVAVFLAFESRGLLIGEQVDSDLMATLRSAVEDDPAVVAIERVRTMHLGPNEVLMTLHVRFADHDADGVIEAIDRLRTALATADERLTDVTIEPVGPASS